MDKYNLLFNISHKVYRIGSRLTDSTAVLGKFLLQELKSDAALQQPIKRSSYLRQGYLSKSHHYYDLESYSLRDYLPDYTGRMRIGTINGRESALTANKLASHQLLDRISSSSCPELFGVIRDGHMFSPKGDMITNDIATWIHNLLEEESIVCKPISGGGGSGVTVFERGGGDSEVVANGQYISVENIGDEINPPAIVTEAINQATYSNAIFPNSVNTIRLLTLQDPDNGIPFVAAGIHRIGTHKSQPTDNWDRGGLSAGINLETGEIEGVAHRRSGQIEWVEHHPDTGERISGVVIPEWNQTCTMVEDMASQLQYLPLIAWDIVLDQAHNPVVIEMNSNPTIDMMQIHKPLLIDQRVRHFFESVDVI